MLINTARSSPLDETVAAMYDTAIDNLIAFYADTPQNLATSLEL